MSAIRNLTSRLKVQPAAPRRTDPSEIDRMYRYWRIRVMYSSVGGYALFYFIRANLAIAAPAITREFRFSNTQWGLVLSASTIVYAVSKFLSGVVGDRANPRYLMGLGLFFSALVNLFFGFGSSLTFFIAFVALNNLFQGTGVPPCARLLTYWFSPKEIGRAWGLWNSSHQIGGGLILLWAGYLVSHHGWRSAFWEPAILCVAGSLWVMNRLTDSPESEGLPPVEVYEGEATADRTEAKVPFGTIFRTQILHNPGVWIVSIANFFIYVVRIGILSWAPKYLTEAKGLSLEGASFAGASFEFAGIFGAIVAGWLSDKVWKGRRGPVSVAYLLVLTAVLAALFFVPSGRVVEMCVLFTALGFLVYGPQMLVAVAATDFSTKVAASSAVGLTGLFGYLGASFCGLATGILVDHFGWNGAVWLYGASALIGCVLLTTTWNMVSPVLAGPGRGFSPNQAVNPSAARTFADCQSARAGGTSMRMTRNSGFLWVALLLGLLPGTGRAQDVTVNGPTWIGAGEKPEEVPSQGYFRPSFPDEVRHADRIGYVLVYRDISPEGKSLSVVAQGNDVVYQRAVEAEFRDWSAKPAKLQGKPVYTKLFFAVLFNPKSATIEGPNASPRLLRAVPLWLDAGQLAGFASPARAEVQLDLDSDGFVADVHMSQADKALEKDIRKGLKRWRFAPARENGKPVAARVDMALLLQPRSKPGGPTGPLTMPVAIGRVSPEYPRIMLQTELRGEVVVKFVVNKDGKVENATIDSSNNPGFEDAALDAIREWKFKPATRGGVPTAATMKLSFTFEIPGHDANDAYVLDGADSSKLPPQFRYDTPPRIRGMILPVYPYELLRDEISGSATVVYVVGPTGHVIFTRVVKASRPEFGRALAAAVSMFQFDPALLAGKPTQTLLRQDQTFDCYSLSFDHAGIDRPYGDVALAQAFQKHPERFVNARLLDHPLRPISRRPPTFPPTLDHPAPAGEAMVEIVIDKDGRAQNPRVVSATDPAFGYSAAQAVAFWRFDPPLKGEKVMTLVKIPFQFSLTGGGHPPAS